MEADEVVIVDVGVVDGLARLHLGLELLHNVAFLDDVMRNLDPGDLLEGLRERFRFVCVGRNGLGHDLDAHALKGLGRVDEPLHFFHLLFFAERRGLKFLVDPLLCCSHVRARRARVQHESGGNRAAEKHSP